MTDPRLEWKNKKIREGCCADCGKPKGLSKRYCDDCLDKIRDRQRVKRNIKNPRKPYLPRTTRRVKSKTGVSKNKEVLKVLEMLKEPPKPNQKNLGPLGEKIPAAEFIKVHKREDNGRKTFIGTYNVNDLSQSETIEEFINIYLEPLHGPGTYPVTVVDVYGREYDAGEVKIDPTYKNLEKEISIHLVRIARRPVTLQMLRKVETIAKQSRYLLSTLRSAEDRREN